MEDGVTRCTPINFRHLATVAIGLPMLLAVVNQLILTEQRLFAAQPFVLVGVMAFYVLQIGCIGWAVGTYARPWPLRWFLLAWIMILVDLQLAVITSSSLSVGESCLATGILAGQLGMLVVWGMLGTGSWLWRIPCLLVVLATYRSFYLLLVQLKAASRFGESWSDLAITQAVLLSVLAGFLRLSGFSLRNVADKLPAPASGIKTRAPRQFGIRDVLLWTTSLAVLLAIAKAGDLLTLDYLKRFYDAGMLLVLTIAACTASIQVVALWAALGQGHVIIRYAVLLLMSLGVGTPIGLYCATLGRQGVLWWWDAPIWIHAGYWWIGWMVLTGLLLSASLVIYRTLGYRLVRRMPKPS